MKRVFIIPAFTTCVIGLASFQGCSHSRTVEVANTSGPEPVPGAATQTQRVDRFGQGSTTMGNAAAAVKNQTLRPVDADSLDPPVAQASYATASRAGDQASNVSRPATTSVPVNASVSPSPYGAVPTLSAEAVTTGPPSRTTPKLAVPYDQSSETTSSLPRGEGTPSRRSYVDITAAACFGHTRDYTQLSGQVISSRLSNGWRLRYASVDEDDAFGGSVTLSGDGHVEGLQDGQYIRAKGHLSNPEEKGIAPTYHVDSFELIDAGSIPTAN